VDASSVGGCGGCCGSNAGLLAPALDPLALAREPGLGRAGLPLPGAIWPRVGEARGEACPAVPRARPRCGDGAGSVRREPLLLSWAGDGIIEKLFGAREGGLPFMAMS